MSRRMFSDEITTSDAFLDMPVDSQLLYFHLGMNADDDGFIANTKMIQRIIRAGDDALKILFAKKFLIAFENGICVVKHWRINNYIRKDIYRETKYIEQKRKLYLRPNGAYSLREDGAIPLPKGHFTLKDKFGKDADNEPAETTPRLPSGKGSKKEELEIGLPDWLNIETWESWVAYRKEIRKKLTITTIKRQLAMLEKNKDNHVAIIEKSIQNGWTGLFEIKDSKKPTQNKIESKAGKYSQVGEKV